MEIFAPFAADWYKPGHKPMYNQNTKLIFSNLTPRNDKNFAHYADKNARGVIVLGLRRMVMDSMVGMWKKFFKMKREAAVKKFARMSKNALGAAAPSAECWGELHDLGYLPVEIRALRKDSSRLFVKMVSCIKWITSRLRRLMMKITCFNPSSVTGMC